MQVLPETRVAGSTHRPGSTDPLPSPDAMVELASGVDALTCRDGENSTLGS